MKIPLTQITINTPLEAMKIIVSFLICWVASAIIFGIIIFSANKFDLDTFIIIIVPTTLLAFNMSAAIPKSNKKWEPILDFILAELVALFFVSQGMICAISFNNPYLSLYGFSPDNIVAAQSFMTSLFFTFLGVTVNAASFYKNVIP